MRTLMLFRVVLFASLAAVLTAAAGPNPIGGISTQRELRSSPAAETAVETHLALVAYVRDELARQGIELVVTLLPSQESPVFPSPDRTVAGVGLYERARRTLGAAGVVTPDVATALRRCKRGSAAFLPPDLQWTEAGARCTVDSILASVPRREYADADTPQQRSLVVVIGASREARSLPTGALRERLHEDVVRYAAAGDGPFVPMLDYLLNGPDLQIRPRLVVWEISEDALARPQDLRVERRSPPCTLGAEPLL